MKALLLKNKELNMVHIEFIVSSIENKEFFLTMNTENDQHCFDLNEVVALRDYLNYVIQDKSW